MKNELKPNNHITTQICLGYTTKYPKQGVLQVVKNKGFCSEITDEINVNSFIKLYREKDSEISVINNNFFST